MPYRSIIVELDSKNVPHLLTLVEESWTVAQHVHDGLRASVRERGGNVIFASLIDAARPIAGCCTSSSELLA